VATPLRQDALAELKRSRLVLRRDPDRFLFEFYLRLIWECLAYSGGKKREEFGRLWGAGLMRSFDHVHDRVDFWRHIDHAIWQRAQEYPAGARFLS
jgi:hypothetical protein